MIPLSDKMAEPPSAYDQLTKHLGEIAIVGSIGSLLHWDQETGMPHAGGEWRAEQLAWIANRQHALLTHVRTRDLLEAAETEGNLTSDAMVNVQWARRDYDRATRLPAAFVEECARTESLAHESWKAARITSDFSIFAPMLHKLVDQARLRADYISEQAASPYDALLDLHEPGATTAEVSALFDTLTPQLSELVELATQKGSSLPTLPDGLEYPVEAQRRFNHVIAEAIGFDFGSGRIDTSTHPFCTRLGAMDHRLTTRYDTRDFTSSLYGVLHECGHGLYEQGLDAGSYGLPVGSAISLGIHESQSRLWENHVGRRLDFWEQWFPLAVDCFPGLLGSTPHELWQYANRVQRSFIRVEADEVTYDLHIILRFRLERALIEGDVEAKDIPGEWNTLFQQLFGQQIPNDSMGCLQDVHWSMGGFGYFSTYTQGNLNAAQLMQAARKAVVTLDQDLADGNYSSLLSWLRKHVHSQGMRHVPKELMQRATGEPTATTAYLRHLKQKLQFV